MDETVKLLLMKVTVEIEEKELGQLAAFAKLPTWIIDEWNQKYTEFNCNPLPVEVVGKLVKQMAGEDLCQCGHRASVHVESVCSICAGEFHDPLNRSVPCGAGDDE